MSCAGNNKIVIEGIDKQKVGEFTAKIRKIYPPEPYKGKGIRYSGEEVRKKLGKVRGYIETIRGVGYRFKEI